jgi:hypothetical protein
MVPVDSPRSTLFQVHNEKQKHPECVPREYLQKFCSVDDEIAIWLRII